ncbi:hypothetical protein [Streptomyces pactum]|uniref:Uncharacterized protein n=1 Tax=Streptomyces pactum TaxID=68249 RepID=A0A1S6JGH1_9ACTN|nr:hypothetical protein [Streptomyces pactum]AQS70844.1 hypothetical protein B1H29_31680 [Streptomyces pactum]
MPDVGDVVTAQLLVAPYDATTTATLAVTAPDGTVSTPVTSTVDSGQTWTAPLTYTAAGVWLLRWTVTGTGASVEIEQVSVAPTPGAGLTGRSYATTTQLANQLQAAPPLDAVRQLADASKSLDDALLTAVYDTDSAGMPTDPDVQAAFAEAVCAIVDWWDETGDELGADGDWQSVSAGPVSMSRGSNSISAQPVANGYLPPRAASALRRLPSEKLRLGVVATPW